MSAHVHERLMRIPVGAQAGSVSIEGMLQVPERADGIVVFAHGSGSSRRSPRNNYVAAELRGAGLGTLLLDLLTPAEDADRTARFDIDLLTARLVQAVAHLEDDTAAKGLPIGAFGASTGAAAALRLAAAEPGRIRAVVSRGGRPDLAGDEALAEVRAPTLLIVGGFDAGVLELNEEAYRKLAGLKEFAVVPGATHLFDEPGTLEHVAALAADWFAHHLRAAKAEAPGS